LKGPGQGTRFKAQGTRKTPEGKSQEGPRKFKAQIIHAIIFKIFNTYRHFPSTKKEADGNYFDDYSLPALIFGSFLNLQS